LCAFSNYIYLLAGVEDEELGEEVVRTPSIVAEAMSKALPDSRATCSPSASPDDEAPHEDTDTDQQQVPVVDEERSRDDEQDDLSLQETGQDDVEQQQQQEEEHPINDDNDATELPVLILRLADLIQYQRVTDGQTHHHDG